MSFIQGIDLFGLKSPYGLAIMKIYIGNKYGKNKYQTRVDRYAISINGHTTQILLRIPNNKGK